MTRANQTLDHGTFALACAAVATLCGAYVLVRLGAPMRHLAVNGGALVVGACFAVALSRFSPMAPAFSGAMSVLLGASLVATALFGVEVEGASRWFSIGGIAMQPAFVAAPLIALRSVCKPDRWSFAATMLAALGLALQPDRALAGALFAALAVAAVLRPGVLLAASAALAGAGFTAALLQPDLVPPSAYVEGVLPAAMAHGVVTGAAAILGLAAVVAPFVVGVVARRPASLVEQRAASAALGAFWAATIVAALIGAYPTPFLGYGASAIIAYGVSAALLSVCGRRAS